MPSWKKVITSGSNAILAQISASIVPTSTTGTQNLLALNSFSGGIMQISQSSINTFRSTGIRPGDGFIDGDLTASGDFSIKDYKLLSLSTNTDTRGPFNPIVGAIQKSGKCLRLDVEFEDGTNGVSRYNNSATADYDGVTVTREDWSQASATAFFGLADGVGTKPPNASGKVMKIHYDGIGEVSPGDGGFVQTIPNPSPSTVASQQNRTYVQIFQALIPEGRYLTPAENNQGPDKKTYFLTNNKGTGKWEWYARVNHVGSSGNLSSAGHIFINETDTETIWYLASCTVYDMTAQNASTFRRIGIGTTNPTYTLDVESTDEILASFVSTDNKAAIQIRDNDTTGYVSAENGRIAIGTSAGTHANNLNIHNTNVGIGTTTPGYKLEVLGEGYATNGWSVGTNETPVGKIFNDSGVFRVRAETARQIAFGNVTNGEFIRINATGNVGIGTTTPSSPIHLVNSSSTTGTSTGTTLLTLTNHVGGDLNLQKSFIDFEFTDTNANFTPQVRIGAEVGRNADADSQAKEGAGAFVVYTGNGNDADPTNGTLTEALRVDYAGNVGIGTTTPTSKLTVDGDITATNITASGNISSNNTIIGLSGSFNTIKATAENSPNEGLFIHANGSDSIIDSKFNNLKLRILRDSDDIELQTSSSAAAGPTTKLFISSSGKVGIGTTSPGDTLTINNDNNLLLGLDAPAGNDAQLRFYSAGAYKSIIYRPANSDDLRINTVQGDALTVLQNKNIGIGTTTPSQMLHISGASGKVRIEDQDHATATPQLYIEGNKNKSLSAIATLIELKSNLDVRGRGIHYTHANTSSNGSISSDEWFSGVPYQGSGFQIGFDKYNGIPWYKESSSLFIKEDGKVGIGTTAPTENLEVAANGADVAIKIHEDAGTHEARLHLRRGGSDWEIINNNHFTIEGEGTERFRIDTSGNVGIGTASPEYILDIQGDSPVLRIADNNTVNSPSASAIWMGENGASEVRGAGIIYDGHANTINLVTSNNGTLTNNNPYNAEKRLTIQESDGNVGIGTTSPNSRLNVKSAGSATDQITLTHSGNTVNIAEIGQLNSHGSLLLRGNNNTAKIQLSASGSHSYINSNKNVGIGTTTPTEKLEVHNTIKIGETGVSGGKLISGDSMIFQIDSDDSGTTSSYRFRKDGTEDDGTELMRIQEDGNVGIGTTNPSEKLTVEGNISSSGNIYLGSGITPFLQLQEAQAERYRITANQTDLEIQVDETTAIAIHQDRNIGIGTLIPSEKLTVLGNISASGDIHATNISASGDITASNLRVDNDISLGGNIFSFSGFSFIEGVSANFTGSNKFGSGSSPSANDAAGGGVAHQFTGSVAITGSGLSISNLNNTATTDFVVYNTETGALTYTNPGLISSSVQISASISGAIDAAISTLSASIATDILNITSSIISVSSSIATDIATNATNTLNTFKLTGQRNGDSAITGSLELRSGSLDIETFNDGIRWYNGSNYTTNRISVTTAQNMQFRAGGAFQFAGGNIQLLQKKKLLLENGNNTSAFRIYNSSDNTGSGDQNNSRLDIQNDAGSTLFSISGSGKVGIGTTSPEQKLTVESGYITVTGSGASGYGYELARAGKDTYRLQHLDNGLAIVNSTDSNRKEMTFDGTGNVGIGTTSPLHPLDVTGRISADQIQLEDANTLIYRNAGNLDLVTYSGYNINLIPASNVGIGTTTPQEKLTVEGNISASGDLYFGDGHFLGDDADDNLILSASAGENIIIGTPDSDIFFRTGSGTAIAIKSTGKVGIGTTSPTELIEVRGETNLTSGVISLASSRNDAQDVPVGVILGKNANSTIAAISMSRGSGTYNGMLTFHTKQLTTFEGGPVERMRIDTNGNVGIGTTTPTSKLNINTTGGPATGSSAALFIESLNGDTSIRIGHNSTTTGHEIKYKGTDSGNNNDLEFLSDNMAISNGQVKWMNVKQDGQVALGSGSLDDGSGVIFLPGSGSAYAGSVGIGTTSPNYKLSIEGGSIRVTNLGTTNVFGSDATGGVIRAFSGDEVIQIQDAGGSEFVRFQGNTKRVGIGTASPTEKLQVEGNISASGDINVNNNSQFKGKHTNGSEYGLLTLTDSNVIKVGAYDYTSAGVIFGGGDNTQFNIGTTEVMKMRSTGLDVTGHITASGNIRASGTGSFEKVSIFNNTSTANPRLSLGRNSAEKLDFSVSDNNITITADQDTDGNADHEFRLNRTYEGTGANNFVIQKAGTDQFIIDANANITASGNISSSGNLFASLSLDNSNLSTVMYNTTTGQFFHTGSYGGGGDGLSAQTISGSWQGQNFVSASQTFLSTGQRDGDSSITGSLFIKDGNLKFSGSNNVITTNGTAGDDLTITAAHLLNLGTSNVDEINIGRQDNTAVDINMYAGTATIAQRLHNGTVKFNVPVTASSNISASGTGSFSKLNIDNYVKIEGGSVLGYETDDSSNLTYSLIGTNQAGSLSLFNANQSFPTIQLNGQGSSIFNIPSKFFIGVNATGKRWGNIITGGPSFSTDTLNLNVLDGIFITGSSPTGKIWLNNGHITASGDISASGDLEARNITASNIQVANDIALGGNIFSFSGFSFIEGVSANFTGSNKFGSGSTPAANDAAGGGVAHQFTGSVAITGSSLSISNLANAPTSNFVVYNTSTGALTYKNGSIANAELTNDSVSYGGVSLNLGESDATPAFDLQDATAYKTTALVGTITNTQLAGSITNAKLLNSSVSYGGVSLSLGGSDATPAFNLQDATAYKTTALVGTITNAQLANDGITIGGVDTSLGETITSATILEGSEVISGSQTFLLTGQRNGNSGITGSLELSGIGHITASGNISASGDITAHSASFTGPVKISLATGGTAFEITEEDKDQKGRLLFEYDNGDPTLTIASRASTAKLHIRQDSGTNGLYFDEDGQIYVNNSTSDGVKIDGTSFSSIGTNTNALDLGKNNRPWKDLYLTGDGANIFFQDNTSGPELTLKYPANSNRLILSASDGHPSASFEVQGNISASGFVSASSLIAFDTLQVDNTFRVSGGSVTFANSLSAGNSPVFDSHLIRGKTTFDGNITASGAISASGNLFVSLSLDSSALNTVMYNTTTGQFFHTGSYSGGSSGGGADNLGNHTATEDLDLANFNIKGITNITASGVISASGALLDTLILSSSGFFSNTNYQESVILTPRSIVQKGIVGHITTEGLVSSSRLFVNSPSNDSVAFFESGDPNCQIILKDSNTTGVVATRTEGNNYIARTDSGSFNVLLDNRNFTALSVTQSSGVAQLDVAGNISASGVISGKMPFFTHHSYDTPTFNNKRYLPSSYGNSAELPLSEQHLIIAPHDGIIKKLMIRCTSNAGLTTISTSVNGTEIGNNITLTNGTSATTGVTVINHFPINRSFNSGDTIFIALDPTNAPGDVNVTCVWEYDTNT